MHELLLFAQVPPSQLPHLLKILAGISAMQPAPLLEHHLVFKPTRAPGSFPAPKPGKPGAALSTQLSNDIFYLQLVGHLSDDLTGSAAGDGADPDLEKRLRDDAAALEAAGVRGRVDEIEFGKRPWTLEFRDLPEVQAKRPATARLMTSVPVVEGDPRRFVEAMGYA